ncbi:MAG: hypothetical protein NVS4B11_34060 [Ktedonobacteraceae bacterium]
MAPTSNQQGHKRFPRTRIYIFITVAIMLFFVLGTGSGVLSIVGAVHGPLPIIVSVTLTVLGVVLAFVRWLFHLIYAEPTLAETLSQPTILTLSVPANAEAVNVEPQITSTDRNAHRNVATLPPPTFPRTIQQRQIMVEEIYNQLIQQDVTAIALTGIGGVGKSTLAALVYRNAEEKRRAGKSPFTAEAIWLKLDSNVTIADLTGTLLDAMDIDKNLTSAHPTIQEQVSVLFNVFNTPHNARLVILDQFESVLDVQTGYVLPECLGMGEWLDALNGSSCASRVLLTSRVRPQGTREYATAYMLTYQVKGFNAEEGIELLRKQGVELTQATESELATGVARCEGHALALILLAAMLRRNRSLNLSTFFDDMAYTQLWTGDIANNLLDYIYTQQLDTTQRKLLLSFSFYRESVPWEAVHMLILEIPKKDVLFALDVLISQHLLEAPGNNLYHLHAIVANYAQSRLDQNDKQTAALNVLSSHDKAAHYYLEQVKKCLPREKRRRSSDVRPVIEAIWHLCNACQWQEAYILMEQEAIFPDLKRWGANATLLEIHLSLLPLAEQNSESSQAEVIYSNLGRVYRTLGHRELAIDYLEKALHLSMILGNRKREGMAHSFLGSFYADLGKKQNALQHLEQALKIRREIKDHEDIGWTLDNLSRIYHDLGQEEDARNCAEQAWRTFVDQGIRRGEGRSLSTLGEIYDTIGQKEQAKRCYSVALDIAREVADRLEESIALNGLGNIHVDLGEKDKALSLFNDALRICRDTRDRCGEGRTLCSLGRLCKLLDQKIEAFQYIEESLSVLHEISDFEGEAKALNVLSTIQTDKDALNTLNDALFISRKIADRRQEGWTLHNIGCVYQNLGQKEEARDHYIQALRIRTSIEDRKGQGWTLHNLGSLYLEEGSYKSALAFLLLAKHIFAEVESPDLQTALQSIERVRKETGEHFNNLMTQVEPRAREIIDETLKISDNQIRK